MARRSSRLAQAAMQQPAGPAITKPPSRKSSLIETSQTSSPTPSKAQARISNATDRSATTELPTLPSVDGPAFRRYMLQAGPSAPGIWLQIAKKGAGIPSVTYAEAVDEALCCGWIDGQRRALDARFFLQRFTPRRRASAWSRRNVDRVAALDAVGRMMPAGRAEVDAARADGRWDRAYAGSAAMEVPADFQALLEARPRAKRAFEALGRTERYPYLYRLQTVKMEVTRTRKMAEFVEMLEMLDRGETL